MRSVFEFVEDVLGEAYPLAVDRDAEQPAAGCAVEVQAAGDARRIDEQAFDLEAQVGDCQEVAFEHPQVAVESDLHVVVAHPVMDEVAQARPVLAVQAVDVGAVALGESVTGHAGLLRAVRAA